ncbi:ankyrin repeat domain-containing protein [Imperialibacter roseus]|uniref:Ankyrin repeat domain-containing protein n=1 Tax=Imperialibacter roseus TaxID=1324217 RepID=A0ABZ0IJM6_9BACT|nr:ankyrin repeat domain-containing protein [Imperialibacter roseus]WOK04719.1 ankyrin repeat domain-containing protein [Imperialibacter roseus]
MKIDSIVPILYATDVAESIRYFTEKLGFGDNWEWDSPPTFGGVNHGKTQIFFCKDGQGNKDTWMSIFIHDVDAYYESIKSKGAVILSPPQTMEWGVREMLVEAPDGHKLRFGTGTSELVMPNNQFIHAIRALDVEAVKQLIEKEPEWLTWQEKDGRNGLHFLSSLYVSDRPGKDEASLQLMKLLVSKGMDIHSICYIPEKDSAFPGTPLWFAYAKGKNKKLYTRLLEKGANPDNCMFAIAWQNDAEAAALFKKYGAALTDKEGKHTPFVAAVMWKKLAVAKWFLENGADVNTTDEHGNTALFYAVKKRYPQKFVETLLKYGADAHIENNEGLSAFKLAEEEKIMKLLKLFKTYPKG